MKLLTPTGFEVEACAESVNALLAAGFQKPKAKEKKAIQGSQKKKGKQMAITAFATIDDLQARWRTLEDSEVEQAQVLLQDATAMLMSKLKRHGVTIDTEDEVQAHNLVEICCAMVRRCMDAPQDMFDATSISQAAGPYSQSFNLSNASGSLYIKKAEAAILGCTQRVGALRPYIEGAQEW